MNRNVEEFSEEFSLGDITNKVLEQVSKLNLKYAKILRNELAVISAEYPVLQKHLVGKFIEYLDYEGKDLQYGTDALLRKLVDIFDEELSFFRTGKYSNSSFEEVNKKVYNNPEVMEYHTIGLLMFEIFTLANYIKFQFFIETLQNSKNNIANYLEIGGGHGLYVWQAQKIIAGNPDFNLVDISETSINIARVFLRGIPVNYFQQDILTFNSPAGYDFISVCEVIEHLERPEELLIKVKSLLKPGGRIFLTVPINNPTIDHIYLFESVEKIRSMLRQNGLTILNEKSVPFQNVSLPEAVKRKLAIDYLVLLKIS